MRPTLLAIASLGLTALLSGQIDPAAAPASALPSFRVLVLPDVSGDTPAQYAEQAVGKLEEVIQAAGFAVTDAEQARLLAQRGESIMRSWLGDREGLVEDAELAMLSQCEVVVRVEVQPVRQRKQQGRYVVQQRGAFRVTFVDAGERVANGEGLGDGRTMDGYDSAHRQALEALCDPAADGSLGQRVVAALTSVRNDEAANGARMTVALYVDNRFGEVLEALSNAVATADGVVPGSYTPLRTYPGAAMADGERGTCNESRIRFRGSVAGLQSTILGALRSVAPALEQEHGIDLRPVVIASGRRLDVVIKASPSVAALADEVQRVTGEAVDTVYRRYGNVLAGQRLTVLPASIAAARGPAAELASFRRAFQQAYDSTEARLQNANRPAADPLTDSGTVQIQDVVYENLAAAKSKLLDLEESFYESSEGELAVKIGEIVGNELRKVSDDGLQVQPLPHDRDRALSFIRLEAAASTEDGAIAPESIAFFEQQGTGMLVTTRLRRFLDEFGVTVTVVDLTSGTKMQGSSAFHPRFTPQLREQLGD
ncbi:MAG: hypothetical protein IPM29_27625 [Planctomycetes bacterium]|nr:hypothetical protein [Planctomycetota bacterium]